MRSRLLACGPRGYAGAMHIYNKLGAAFMFLMAGGCLFFRLGIAWRRGRGLGNRLLAGVRPRIRGPRRLGTASKMTADHPYDFERPIDAKAISVGIPAPLPPGRQSIRTTVRFAAYYPVKGTFVERDDLLPYLNSRSRRVHCR